MTRHTALLIGGALLVLLGAAGQFIVLVYLGIVPVALVVAVWAVLAAALAALVRQELHR